MIYQGADKLITRIRRRIEDKGANQFTNDELLDIVEENLGGHFMTAIRAVQLQNDVAELSISTSTGLVPIDAVTYDYVLPENVAAILRLEGQRSPGVTIGIEPIQLDLRNSTLTTVYHWVDDRTIRIKGNPTAFPTLNLLYVRKNAPLHWGVAQGGTTSTLQFAASPTAGAVVQRDDLYIGMDILITADSGGAANVDTVRKIVDYEGATRTATISTDTPWPAAVSATTNYALVVPIDPDATAYLVEEVAREVFESTGRILPMPRLRDLKEQFETLILERGGPRRIFNYGGT